MRRSFAIFASGVARRIAVVAILGGEIALLCLIAFWGRSLSADGLMVKPGSASIAVEDQTGPWGVVKVKSVVAPAPSWLVVQSQGADGRAGTVLGSTRIPAGTTSDVAVNLDPTQGAVNLLVLSILGDRGQAGVFEYTPAVSSGGGGMGGSPQGASAGMSTAQNADKPLVSGGKPVVVRLAEASRTGVPGTVHRVVAP